MVGNGNGPEFIRTGKITRDGSSISQCIFCYLLQSLLIIDGFDSGIKAGMSVDG